jgi:hypothetical protein
MRRSFTRLRRRSALLALAALVCAPAAPAGVATYPSAQTILPSGPLPPGGGKQLVLNASIGEREGGLVVVTGAQRISLNVAPPQLGEIAVRLFFGHYVAAGNKLVPDALLPWDGLERSAEKANQPIYVQAEIPYGTKPGAYTASLTVTADGKPTNVALTVNVFPVTLPQPATPVGNLLTSFHLSAESYVNKAGQLYGFSSHDQRIAANSSLYAFLASYRISPGSWGFGEPKAPTGYEGSAKWWLDAAGNFRRQLAVGPGFSTLRIPISNNRTSERNYIAGLSPYKPETWCDYLGRIRSFWTEHGALKPDTIPYLYSLDEPGLEGQRLVARQAKSVHSCFPGAQQILTGNPSPANAFLWDNKGGDDVDIWVVLSRRYYGRFTVPAQHRAGQSRARGYLGAIDKVRARGKRVWSYTYSGTAGTPGFAATEPLSNPRMLLLWNALEGVQGLLYGQGTTSYTKTNPLDSIGSGEFVLLYPGPYAPIASARLEQIRDGIEDWSVLNMIRVRRGAGVVRSILGDAGLFSATSAKVKLGCSLNCDLKSATKFSWPIWSRDASTAGRIETARLRALKLAG